MSEWHDHIERKLDGVLAALEQVPLLEINERLNNLEHRDPYRWRRGPIREPSDPIERLYNLVEDLLDIIATLEDAEKLRGAKPA